ELEEDCILGNTGDKVTGKEYHRSIVKTNEEEIYKITKPKSERSWKCGYQKNNILVGYPHIHFLGNKKVLDNILDSVHF
ncbi:MAG TPA: cobyrinate a,c-diamide synthase, partial [Tissierellaceae bacterium]|nr:cobyrinate a,c-diamide synthase [Tissierellaceae bacterium]